MNYYDENFIKTLASGLDARWNYSETSKYKEDDSLTKLKKSTEIEYNILKKVLFLKKVQRW